MFSTTLIIRINKTSFHLFTCTQWPAEKALIRLFLFLHQKLVIKSACTLYNGKDS